MGYSLTTGGILLAVAVPLLARVGFSEVCANEVITIIIPLLGGVLAWIGRVRIGDVNIFGFRK